jgi:hypothetical protein
LIDRRASGADAIDGEPRVVERVRRFDIAIFERKTCHANVDHEIDIDRNTFRIGSEAGLEMLCRRLP